MTFKNIEVLKKSYAGLDLRKSILVASFLTTT